MTTFIFLALILIIIASIYLAYLNSSQQSNNSPAQPAPQLNTVDQALAPKIKAQQRRYYLKRIFLINILIYLLQFFIPFNSLGYFGGQLGLNIIATIFCFMTGRTELGKTFLLCFLWVFLIGPLILGALCFGGLVVCSGLDYLR